MIYLLASTHTAPADHFTVGVMQNVTSYYLRLAEAGDPVAIALLAQAGIVPHYPLANPDDGICGATWVEQEDGSFVEIASGTAEAIAAALEAAAAQAVIDARATLSCTALQALLAIDAMGMAPIYEAWTADPARTFAEKAFVAKAQHWERNNAVFVAVKDMLGKTDEEADNFIKFASTL